ncbi:hypothetical protein FRC08_005359 [Ceratobasidium sp. 394]|nr:hypothetical protein FRC08_005359 [Ceratobasidium sp. 394]
MSLNLESALFCLFSSALAIVLDSGQSAVYDHHLSLPAGGLETTRPSPAIAPIIRGCANRLSASTISPASPPPIIPTLVTPLDLDHTRASPDLDSLVAPASGEEALSRPLPESHGEPVTTGQPAIITIQILPDLNSKEIHTLPSCTPHIDPSTGGFVGYPSDLVYSRRDPSRLVLLGIATFLCPGLDILALSPSKSTVHRSPSAQVPPALDPSNTGMLTFAAPFPSDFPVGPDAPYPRYSRQDNSPSGLATMTMGTSAIITRLTQLSTKMWAQISKLD